MNTDRTTSLPARCLRSSSPQATHPGACCVTRGSGGSYSASQHVAAEAPVGAAPQVSAGDTLPEPLVLRHSDPLRSGAAPRKDAGLAAREPYREQRTGDRTRGGASLIGAHDRHFSARAETGIREGGNPLQPGKHRALDHQVNNRVEASETHSTVLRERVAVQATQPQDPKHDVPQIRVSGAANDC